MGATFLDTLLATNAKDVACLLNLESSQDKDREITGVKTVAMDVQLTFNLRHVSQAVFLLRGATELADLPRDFFSVLLTFFVSEAGVDLVVFCEAVTTGCVSIKSAKSPRPVAAGVSLVWLTAGRVDGALGVLVEVC